MPPIVSLAMLLFLIAGTSAQAQQAAFPFAYAGCQLAAASSPFSAQLVAPLLASSSVGCWSLRYTPPADDCSGPCCFSDIASFDLEASSLCERGFSGTATLSAAGRALFHGRAVLRTFAGGSRAAVSVRDFPELTGKSADGAQLCITLGAASPCNWSNLTASAAGAAVVVAAGAGGEPAAATWAVALVDSVEGCCPVFRSVGSSVSTTRCEHQRLTWGLIPSNSDEGSTAFFDDDATGLRRERAELEIRVLLEDDETLPVVISEVTISCVGGAAEACFKAAAKEAGEEEELALGRLESHLQRLGPEIAVGPVFGIGSGGCPLALAGSSPILELNGVQIAQAASCAVSPVDNFPACSCDTTQHTTWFGLGPGISQVPNTNTYCLNVTVGNIDTTQQQEGCSNATILSKVEVFLDASKRRDIRSISILHNSVPVEAHPQLWAGNSLKVTGLNWTPDYVKNHKPQICFALRKDASLMGMAVPGLSYVYGALFNPDSSCCPTYPAEMPELTR